MTELQQQCDVEAASVIELEAEKKRVSLVPHTDHEYTRSTYYIAFLRVIFTYLLIYLISPKQ